MLIMLCVYTGTNEIFIYFLIILMDIILIRYKIYFVNILLFRAFDISSSYNNFHNEIVKIKYTLLINCFPCAIIDKVIMKF